MKLTINQEFAKRHLFVAIVFLGMGGWFGYDGMITYPKMEAAKLYESIEKSAPPATMSSSALEAFKLQKIQTQYGLMGVLMVAAFIVLIGVIRAKNFYFHFDETGFTTREGNLTFDKIDAVDRSAWDKKGILVLKLKGLSIKLDAWHHNGVNEFEKLLKEKTGK